MKKRLVVFGTEKMAQLAYFYFTQDSPYEVVAFTINEQWLKEKQFCNLPVVPFENIESVFPPGEVDIFIAIGYKKLNSLRTLKYNEAKAKGYNLASYLCSKATHWGDTIIGDNCFILENQVIQPFVTFGNNVFIWSGNHFGHDVTVKDNCWISSHVVLCGGVTIEENCFLGVNSTIRDNVTIGRECIIGAGALILNDTQEKEVFIAQETERYALNSEYFERMMEISR